MGDNCGAFLIDASNTNYTTVSFDAGNGTQCNGMADSIYLEIDGQCFRIADGRAEDSVVVLPASKMFRVYVCRNGNGDVGVCDVRGGGAPGADPVVTVSKTDALLIETTADGNANPGETIRYTVTVANTQANTVAGMVTFNDVPGANTN